MRAISTLSFDAGRSTRVWREPTALRIRVSMSAIGSGITISSQSVVSRRSSVLSLQPTEDDEPWNLGTLNAGPLQSRNLETQEPSSYQLLLVTPATSPLSANSRKQRRQSANLRRNARGRPHRRQRLRWRTLNFSVFFSRATLAVVAMVLLRPV